MLPRMRRPLEFNAFHAMQGAVALPDFEVIAWHRGHPDMGFKRWGRRADPPNPRRCGRSTTPATRDQRSRLRAASVVHAARGHRGRRRLLLRLLGDHRFGRDQEARDRRCVLQGRADHLGRIDDAELEQVAVLVLLRVVAKAVVGLLQNLADHDRTVDGGVLDNLPSRLLDRLADDLDAGALIIVLELHALERIGRPQQRDAAARQNALARPRRGWRGARRRRGLSSP